LSRIEDRFESLRRSGEKALIPFIAAGDPSPEATLLLMQILSAAGADIIELGVPFSDPVADGPVNQAAYYRALNRGVTPSAVLDVVKRFRAGDQTPVALLTYYNPVLQRGCDRFAEEAAGSGVDGVIVVDLPTEEAGEWISSCRRHGVDTIFLAAPTSGPDRIEAIAESSTGFIYCVSRTGVTGTRDELPPDLERMMAEIRSMTPKPLAVGFGISSPEQVRKVCAVADGAIVGSALVKIVAGCPSEDQLSEPVSKFLSNLKAATLPAEGRKVLPSGGNPI
jgi:tryptophan synthase alpha chain